MLSIHLFGHFRVFQNDRLVHFSALPQTLPLWVYLLLNRAEAIPRDALAFLLWPDTSEGRARANLRRHLYDLRRALPAPFEDTPWVLSQAGTLQWNPAADYWLDVADFERLSASPEHLARAVELYTGDLLPEVYADWVAVDRERLRNMVLSNLSQLVVQSRARGDNALAMAYAQRILVQDPLREDAVRELIALRYRAGDRAGALQAYQRFEQLLVEELGVSPMPETRALCAAVAQSVPLPEAAPPGVLGQTRTDPCPHNIPAPLNEFVGRERDLLAVRDRLIAVDSRVRLLTLTGPAGTGKTRLALEAVTGLLPDQSRTFPDGVFFVDLSAIERAGLVVSSVAGVLGVKERGGLSLDEGLKRFLRSRYVLLLLDNFEQVLDAGPLIGELLAAAPNLRMLVTSRAALRIYGEHEYPVTPLPLPNLGDLPGVDCLAANAAVALFVARSRERQPDFALTAENAGDVAALCVQLEGLPLAIELAAGRVKAFPPAAALERLTDQLAFLANGPRDRPARLQTLRGAIDWSYRLLDEEEQALLASLGVFAGGFTVESTEAIYGGDTAKGLASLLANSLLYHVNEGEDPRFGMLATIREYALEKMVETGRLKMVAQRHAAYFADLVAQATQARRGPQQGTWFGRLKVEEDNLRAALSWALDPAAPTERLQMGAQMARDLDLYWETHGRLSEASDWYARALKYREHLPPELQTGLLSQASWFAQLQGDYVVAESFCQEGLVLARQTQSPELIVRVLHNLGLAAGRQGAYERADAMLSEAIDVQKAASGGVVTADLVALYNNLAIVAKHLGDYERAESLLRASLDYKRAQGDQWGVAISLANLGELALVRKDYASAESSFQESLRLRQDLGDDKGMLILLAGLAELALVRGKMVSSIRLYSASQSLRQQTGFPMTGRERTQQERNVALLYEQLGKADFAAAWEEGASMTLEQAVACAQDVGASLPPHS